MTDRPSFLLPPGEIALWLLDPARATADWIERHRGLLAAEEVFRAETIPLASVRHEYLSTRILLRLVLSGCRDIDPMDWRFATRKGGRPDIDYPSACREIQFSISHTEGLIAIALCSGCDVGVDVEPLSHAVDAEAVAKRFFAAEETEALLALDGNPRRLRFLQLWTLKEATLKALGTGLATPLDHVCFDIRADGSIVGRIDDPSPLPAECSWRWTSMQPTPAHMLGLACPWPRDMIMDPRPRWFEPRSPSRE